MSIPAIFIVRRLAAFSRVLAGSTYDILDVVRRHEVLRRRIKPVPEDKVARGVGSREPILGKQLHKGGLDVRSGFVQRFVEPVTANIPAAPLPTPALGCQPA